MCLWAMRRQYGGAVLTCAYGLRVGNKASHLAAIALEPGGMVIAIEKDRAYYESPIWFYALPTRCPVLTYAMLCYQTRKAPPTKPTTARRRPG
eukprot:3941631-Rhodomonas_salina.4